MKRVAALPVLAALAVASFLFAVVASVLAPDPEAESAAADTFSRSAIGHRALVETLRRDGVPVVVSRWNSGRRAGTGAVLLLLEPSLEGGDAEARLAQMLADAQRVILVLPKWAGPEDPERPGWLKTVHPVGEGPRRRLLAAAGVEATPVRGRSGRVECDPWPATFAAPAVLLVPTDGAGSIVGCGDGSLAVGKAAGARRILVVSDPDVLSNHGLARGENAKLLRGIVDTVLRPGETLVVDETLHGFQRPPSVWRELFRWPLAAALVQALLTLGVLVAASLPRFGRPLVDEPAIAPGKEVLVRNTSDLLAGSGLHGWLLRRYLENARRDVLIALRGPRTDARSFLAEAERRRGVPSLAPVVAAAAALHDRASASDALRLAGRVHRWKEEMTRAARRRP